MKIFKCFLCIIISAAMLASFTAYAADSYISLDGFTFYINDMSQAVIHEYVGSDENVVIPEKLLGFDVVMIEDYAFFKNTVIKSVSFDDATNLSSIGACAFYGCTALTELDLPAVTLSSGVFQNCTGLRSVTIESGATSIPSQAFLGCDSLVDVEIPDSVTSIADNAFNNCPEVVIYCNEGSYAESYAQDKDADFLVLSSMLYGDTDADGDIDIVDVTYIQLYRISKYLPTERGLFLADATVDGNVNVRDATAIQLYLVGRQTAYRTGTPAYN